MKETMKKVLGIFIVIVVLIASFIIPTNIGVYAEDVVNNTKLVIQSNSNTISIDVSDTNKLVYKIGETIVGYAKVKLNDSYITPVMNNNKPEFTLTKWTTNYQVAVEVAPVTGYKTQPNYFYVDQAHSDSFPGEGNLNLDIFQNNIHVLDFNFEVDQDNGGNQQNNNDPQDGTIDQLKFDFTINGESFTNVSIGDNVLVSDSFNTHTLSEFYVTKIVDDHAGKTYNYAVGEYSYELLDNQNRHIFEVKSFDNNSNDYARLVLETHAGDILDSDIAQGKTKDDYFGFFITGIKFVKREFRGVGISTNVKPDNYDFTMWNGSNLNDTTQNTPGKVTAYYGEETINFNSETASRVKKIELVEGNGVPSSAVEINNENGTIKVLSNYYNNILVKIELEDGTIGYVNINRVGIFIGDLNKDQNTFYHGAAAMVSGNLNVETDKQRIVAVFYHENTTTYNDYDLIVNITYTNGTKETRIAKGVGDVPNSEGPIIGSDYILWSGDSIANTIDKVSVTAVKKGALTNDTTFGGATFGSGTGVVWENRR